MAKPKTPLLSLEAHGTLADTLTYQGRGQRKITRKKPCLPYFLTLPVQYQRWLYEDYAHLWRAQSAATQKAYRADGVRFHLTGFQYWMKYNLTNLPDIVAIWRLDTLTGGITPDTSRNAHNATVIGASPTIGPVARALTFDGINDYFKAPAAFVIPLDYLTIEFWLQRVGLPDAWDNILTQNHTAPANGIRLLFSDALGTLYFALDTAGVTKRCLSTAPITTALYHVTLLYNRVAPYIYLDAVIQPNTQAKNDDIGTPNRDLFIATHFNLVNWAHVIIDNIIIYNRALTQTEITRHAARRWPHQ